MSIYSQDQFRCVYRGQEALLVLGAAKQLQALVQLDSSHSYSATSIIFNERNYANRLNNYKIPTEPLEFVLHIYSRGQFPCYTLVQALIFV
jgi:hypothetical protein